MWGSIDKVRGGNLPPTRGWLFISWSMDFMYPRQHGSGMDLVDCLRCDAFGRVNFTVASMVESQAVQKRE